MIAKEDSPKLVEQSSDWQLAKTPPSSKRNSCFFLKQVIALEHEATGTKSSTAHHVKRNFSKNNNNNIGSCLARQPHRVVVRFEATYISHEWRGMCYSGYTQSAHFLPLFSTITLLLPSYHESLNNSITLSI